MPLPAVLSAVEAQKPEVVALSATMPFSLPRTVAPAGAIRARFQALRVVVGGRAFRATNALVAELGVE